jgi:hypothetical protein
MYSITKAQQTAKARNRNASESYKRPENVGKGERNEHYERNPKKRKLIQDFFTHHRR